MKGQFTFEIDELKSSLIKMASLVDSNVQQAILSLEMADPSVGFGIKEKDEEIDAYDELIQAKVEHLLAIFQPVASDLRFIISSLMINNQLERCGDIAVNISRRVNEIYKQREIIFNSSIIEMGKNTRIMIGKAIDAFINNDPDMAKKVISFDERVDELNKGIFKYSVEKMMADPKNIESSAHLLILSKHIERLADHATNIAEHVLFKIEARIVTHRKIHYDELP